MLSLWRLPPASTEAALCLHSVFMYVDFLTMRYTAQPVLSYGTHRSDRRLPVSREWKSTRFSSNCLAVHITFLLAISKQGVPNGFLRLADTRHVSRLPRHVHCRSSTDGCANIFWMLSFSHLQREDCYYSFCRNCTGAQKRCQNVWWERIVSQNKRVQVML